MHVPDVQVPSSEQSSSERQAAAAPELPLLASSSASRAPAAVPIVVGLGRGLALANLATDRGESDRGARTPRLPSRAGWD